MRTIKLTKEVVGKYLPEGGDGKLPLLRLITPIFVPAIR
jgi:hypothetical protein